MIKKKRSFIKRAAVAAPKKKKEEVKFIKDVTDYEFKVIDATKAKKEFNYFDENDEIVLSAEIDDNMTAGCCGITSWVELVGDDSYINNKAAIAYCVKLLGHLVEEKTTKAGSHTIMITTNGPRECALWEKVLRLSPDFNAVKTFKNPSSRNDVTIWVSNN